MSHSNVFQLPGVTRLRAVSWLEEAATDSCERPAAAEPADEPEEGVIVGAAGEDPKTAATGPLFPPPPLGGDCTRVLGDGRGDTEE